jgi:hypothetical protein
MYRITISCPRHQLVSGQPHAPAALPRGSVDSRDDMDELKLLTLPGFQLRPLGHPARSHSVYRLSYRGSLWLRNNSKLQTPAQTWLRLGTRCCEMGAQTATSFMVRECATHPACVLAICLAYSHTRRYKLPVQMQRHSKVPPVRFILKHTKRMNFDLLRLASCVLGPQAGPENCPQPPMKAFMSER